MKSEHEQESSQKDALVPEQAKPKCQLKKCHLCVALLNTRSVCHEQEESHISGPSLRFFYSNAMILRFCILLLGLPRLCWSWSSSSPLPTRSFRPAILTPSFMSSEQQVPLGMDLLGSSELVDNPCWQDIYDDDCSMSNIYSANFIAGKWIKSMPCGAGIEVSIGDRFLMRFNARTYLYVTHFSFLQDCDMPLELQVPAAHLDLGIEKTDVMAFLGLKRAISVDAKDEKGKMSP